MANPLIIGGRLTASGTGAIGIYCSGDTTIAHVDSITATTSISVVSGATALVIGNQFDPTATAGAGTVEYQYGDRAVWDALNYQAKHANDIDNAAGIHWTKAELDSIYLAIGAAAGGDLTGTYPNPTIANDAVTYAKMQNVSATQRVLGRNTAGAGDTEEVTASQVLDWIGSTRGSILYRGASGWAILAPGTVDYVLTSNGAGADPSYQLGSREVLMADGVTPPDPLTTEAEDDWLYEG